MKTPQETIDRLTHIANNLAASPFVRSEDDERYLRDYIAGLEPADSHTLAGTTTWVDAGLEWSYVASGLSWGAAREKLTRLVDGWYLPTFDQLENVENLPARLGLTGGLDQGVFISYGGLVVPMDAPSGSRVTCDLAARGEERLKMADKGGLLLVRRVK